MGLLASLVHLLLLMLLAGNLSELLPMGAVMLAAALGVGQLAGRLLRDSAALVFRTALVVFSLQPLVLLIGHTGPATPEGFPWGVYLGLGLARAVGMALPRLARGRR
jgi:hypothetical protein